MTPTGGRRRWAVEARMGDAIAAFVTFLLVSTAAAAACLALAMCADLVWTDLLHVNPYRTSSNVAAMMLLSPLYGLAGAVFLLGWPIVAGAVLASVTAAVSGDLCRWRVAAVACACTVLFVHGCYIGAEQSAETPDWRDTSPPWYTLIGGSAILTAAFFCSRWVFLRLFRQRTIESA